MESGENIHDGGRVGQKKKKTQTFLRKEELPQSASGIKQNQKPTR